MVDLPGITKVPVGDQPSDIEHLVRNMCMKYVKQKESIILSVKAHRDYYLSKNGSNNPEMVIATTAHPAFEKAANLMKIKLVKVKVGVDLI